MSKAAFLFTWMLASGCDDGPADVDERLAETIENLVDAGYAPEDIDIIDNPALTSLTGLDNLAAIGWDLNIWGNEALCQSFVDAFAAQFPANLLNDSSCFYYYGYSCSYNDVSC